MAGNLGFDTRKVHSGHNPSAHNRSSAVPIY